MNRRIFIGMLGLAPLMAVIPAVETRQLFQYDLPKIHPYDVYVMLDRNAEFQVEGDCIRISGKWYHQTTEVLPFTEEGKKMCWEVVCRQSDTKRYATVSLNKV